MAFTNWTRCHRRLSLPWRTRRLVPPYVSRSLQRRGGAQALAGPPDGSFGAALQACHDHNGFPYPGSRKGLPYDYVTIHDVHHVIGGLPSITWES